MHLLSQRVTWADAMARMGLQEEGVDKMVTEYDLFADVYDHQFAGLDQDLDFYIDEAQRAQPPVLELACGTGRVTLAIAQAGVPIVGVDSSEGMLHRAQDKADKLGSVPVSWIQADMRDFCLEERFGLVIIPARSFLHLLDAADQVQALANIREHLVPGGRLILNLFVPDLQMIAEHSTSTKQMLKFLNEFEEPDSGARVAVWGCRRYDVHRQRIHQQYRYEQIDDNGFVVATRQRSLTLCYIWPREMEHLLIRSDFEVEALYGWFDRRAFDADSQEQLWVARRT
jgi:ubiquinone/menaquinone biosynthesis C-methylase UbiE